MNPAYIEIAQRIERVTQAVGFVVLVGLITTLVYIVNMLVTDALHDVDRNSDCDTNREDDNK